VPKHLRLRDLGDADHVGKIKKIPVTTDKCLDPGANSQIRDDLIFRNRTPNLDNWQLLRPGFTPGEEISNQALDLLAAKVEFGVSEDAQQFSDARFRHHRRDQRFSRLWRRDDLYD